VVHGPADMGFMDWQNTAHVMFFVFSFLFYPFSLVLLNYIPIFFLFLYINKASPRLTPYRLKGKKGVERLRTPYRLKNYASYIWCGWRQRKTKLDMRGVRKERFKELEYHQGDSRE
jgi:hypothetical protein